MQRLYIFLSFLIFSGPSIWAQQLQEKKVDGYAKAAFRYYTKAEKSQSQLEIKDSFTQKKDGHDFYHIVNFQNGGFVILSGNKNYDAVLGFSDTGNIDTDKDDQNIGLWGELDKHEKSMERILKAGVKASPIVSKQWNKLELLANTDSNLKNMSFTPVVGPLTTTKWQQSGWYNEHIPIDSNTIARGTNAGCVPIAIAQTLRYYASQIPGAGSISYEDPIHGTLSADFCGQTFDYANMPDELDEYNPTLSQFILEVGVSMETHYDNRSTGTYRSKIPDALVYNFGFDQNIRWYTGVDRQRHSETLRTEFDAGRVVVLAAKRLNDDGSIRSGHVWVSDGYGYSSDNVEYMHMNWGWGGNDNGWFLDTPGAWTPHSENVDQDSIPYYYYRTTYYNIKPAEEFCVSPDSRDIEIGPRDKYAWVYNSRSDDELVKFRYRESGTSQWVETDPTYERATFVGNLTEGTTYQYETARNCCGDWSRFSDTAEFSTIGDDPGDDDPVEENECLEENTSEMSTSAVKDNSAYIYTGQPNGRVNNRFRYRILDSGNDWIEIGEDSKHYRGLRDLSPGTSYEFQVDHECSADNWSGYSESLVFTTTGTAPVDDTEPPTEDDVEDNIDPNCKKEDIARMKTSSVKDHSAYAYTRFPNGRVNNTFRYRAVGTTDWTITDTAISHYRALRDLEAGTSYEYQVNHQCGDNSYSGYSDSHVFTTTGTPTDHGDDPTENENEENNNEENNSEENDTEMPIDTNCQREDPEDMKVSGIKDDFAYIYTRHPNGRVNNIFRYRVVGSTTWTMTDESIKHYRAISNLSPQTTYEYQVNHECSANAWSGWSVSFSFGTLSFTSNESVALRSVEKPLPYVAKDNRLKISVFPNPTSDHLNVLVKSEYTNGSHSKASVVVIDQTGRIVNRTIIENQKEIQLNISDLSNGMYILRYIDTNGSSALSRFIKL